MNFSYYVEILFLTSMTGVLDVMGRRDLYDDLSKRRGLGLVCLLGMSTWSVYLVRRREKIVKKCRDFPATLLKDSSDEEDISDKEHAPGDEHELERLAPQVEPIIVVGDTLLVECGLVEDPEGALQQERAVPEVLITEVEREPQGERVIQERPVLEEGRTLLALPQARAASEEPRWFYVILEKAANRYALLRNVFLVVYIPIACWYVFL